MMLKRLRSWQPEASEEQLSAFIQEHGMLLDVLDESWQKFVKQRAELFQAAPPVYESHYAEGFSVDDLRHEPVTNAELMAFLSAFDRERTHNDRPFGDHVEYAEQDWEIEE